MKTKSDIVRDWLPRYTGLEPEQFGRHILLVNFNKYVDMFAEMTGSPVDGKNAVMRSATADGITIINFGMGGANAALIMDLLLAIPPAPISDYTDAASAHDHAGPNAVLFLGKCGGLKDNKCKLGDLILPIGAMTWRHNQIELTDTEIPAIPALQLQKAVSTTIREHGRSHWSGSVYTTNRRIWEHDEEFKENLRRKGVMAVDMETAQLFSVAYQNRIPTGALLLVSDQPMTPEGVKTRKSDSNVTATYVEQHLQIGIDSLKQIIDNKETVRHLLY